MTSKNINAEYFKDIELREVSLEEGEGH
jgi:hypothetical protein